MAITPFSTPAQQQFIPLQDYTPVGMIGNVINKLDARQAEGLAAADRMDLLRTELGRQVLPEQQQFADDMLQSVGAELAALAESGDYIDALPKLRRLSTGLVEKMSPLNENYAAVQARKKAIQDELLKRPEAFTPNDIEYFLNQPQRALASDPNAQFSAPILTTRVDRNKLLNDFFKDMEPDQTVSFINANGMEVKKTVKELTPEDIRQAGTSLLRANTGVAAELQRDYEAAKQRLGPGAAEQFAWSKWMEIDGRKKAVEADPNLSADQKQQIVDSLNEAQDNLDANPEAFFRQSFEQDILGQDVSPYENRAYTQTSVTTKANPYDLARFNSMLRQSEQLQKEARQATRDSKNNSDLLYWNGTLTPTPFPVPPSTNVSSMIEQADQTVAELQERMQTPGLPPQDYLAMQQQIDDIQTRISTTKHLRDKAATELGIDPEAMAIIESGKPQVPTSVTPKRIEELQNFAKSGIGGEASSQMIRRMNDEEVQYYQNYRDWYGNLNSAAKDQNKAIDKWMKKAFDNRGSESAMVAPITGEKKTQLTAMVNDIVGLRYFEGTPEDGKEIELGVNGEERPDITDLSSVTTVPVGLPDGTMAYRLQGRDKDGKAYTMVASDNESLRNWLGRVEVEGKAVNTTESGRLLNGLGDGMFLDPIIGGQNILGPGGSIQRQGNSFIIKLADDTGNIVTERASLDELVQLMESARASAYQLQANE